ncbi:MAG TPA: hypothetical protein VKV95_17445 [Terriglobia bacterium]|nr:hypothetical protein [Terriglobia bacterium]
MPDIDLERISRLEGRNRLLTAWCAVITALAIAILLIPPFGTKVAAQNNPKTLSASELSVVDDHGTVRVRIGAQLPDAVVNGKTLPRGQRAAGILLYDETGEERSGYVTFAPSGNVGLTLDNRDGQTAEFIAGPSGGAGLRIHWQDDAVDLRSDEDGPSIHAVRKKKVAFHEPPVANPESTELCKALRQAKSQLSAEQLWDACRARSSEAACRTCIEK